MWEGGSSALRFGTPQRVSLIDETCCAGAQLAQQLRRVTSLVNEMATILSASAIVG